MTKLGVFLLIFRIDRSFSNLCHYLNIILLANRNLMYAILDKKEIYEVIAIVLTKL